MISLSDNMATDALIHLVGKASIEAITPRNAPFPTTAEMFKLQTDAEALKAWSEADAAGKRALLQRLDARPPPDARGADKAGDHGGMVHVGRRAMQAARTGFGPARYVHQSGPGDAKRWRSAAFKGGSDGGVLNFSLRLTGKGGTVHCVVASWNRDQPIVDMAQLSGPYRGILRKLGEPDGKPPRTSGYGDAK